MTRFDCPRVLGATATLDTMRRADPHAPVPPLLRIQMYAFSGKLDSVQMVWQRTAAGVREAPLGDETEGIAMVGLGRNADAERVRREGEAALGPPSPLRVVALARLGRAADARAQLRLVEQAFGTPYFPPELIATGLLLACPP